MGQSMNNNLQNEINELRTKARILSAPAIRKFARKNPDADISVSLFGSDARVDARVYLRADDSVDISGHDGVWVDSSDYNLTQRVDKGRVKVAGVSVNRRLTLTVVQPLSDDEKELLRSIGKLQRVENSYETLVCGV
jgi:hypothetical protein